SSRSRLWGCCGRWGWPGDDLVDLAGDVAFEASDGFAAGLAFGLSAVDVVRSPPRLSLRRLVFPDDASTGLTPHNAAKDFSLCSRCGLSPAAMSSAAAVSGPTP